MWFIVKEVAVDPLDVGLFYLKFYEEGLPLWRGGYTEMILSNTPKLGC